MRRPMRRRTLSKLVEKEEADEKDLADVLGTFEWAFFELRRLKPKTVGCSMHLSEKGEYIFMSTTGEMEPLEEGAKKDEDKR